MPKFKITIDTEKCIGCGACEATCPASFEVKEGKARAKKPEVSSLGCIQEAADTCPVSCIHITKK